MMGLICLSDLRFTLNRGGTIRVAIGVDCIWVRPFLN